MTLATPLVRLLTGAALAAALLGFVAPTLSQDQEETYPPCAEVLKMGQEKFMDGVRDLSTAGMRSALGHYTGCVDERNQALLADRPEAERETFKKLQAASNDLIAGQWDIFGAGGGTMYLLFYSGGAADVAEMVGQILIPAEVKFPDDPKAAADALRDAVNQKIPQFEAPVKEYEAQARQSRSDYDRDAAVAARQGYRRMVGAWDRLRTVTERMDDKARWIVYRLMDERLDPKFGA